MFRITTVAVALALLTACGGSAPDTPEDVARIAFDGLRSGDTEDCASILPTEEDVEWALEAIRREEGAEALREARRNIDEQGGVREKLDVTHREFRDSLTKARERAAYDFDWSTARFAGIDESRLKPRKRKGLEYTSITFHVKAGRIVYVFELSDCIKTERGWICVDVIRYRGPK